jgi:hypothetical protein
LARFAFHGPIWHPIVAVLVIAAFVGVNLLQQRRRGGPTEATGCGVSPIADIFTEDVERDVSEAR